METNDGKQTAAYRQGQGDTEEDTSQSVAVVAVCELSGMEGLGMAAELMKVSSVNTDCEACRIHNIYNEPIISPRPFT